MKKLTILALSITLLILTSMANAKPPTNIIGSWSCKDATTGDPNVLVSFNNLGVFTASGNLASISVNHGSWVRTGLNTFNSTDLAFIYDTNGIADSIAKTNATNTMPDENNLSVKFEITITDLAGNVIAIESAEATCERIQVE